MILIQGDDIDPLGGLKQASWKAGRMHVAASIFFHKIYAMDMD